MKFWSSAFLIFFIIVSSLLSWYNMIYCADTLPPFYSDEVAYVQSATSFFSHGSYINDRYGLMYGNGIAVTWPSAVGWFIGHNMLSSRLACTFFSWLFGLGLGFYFLRREKFAWPEALATVVCLWAIMITSPLAFPFWYGFMFNLGEINTVILIGFGLMWIGTRSWLSVLILGIAIWHGKMIYAPLVGAILLGNLIVQKLPPRRLATTVLMYALCFFFPLLLWIVWLSLRFDVATAQAWISTQLNLLEMNRTTHLPLSRHLFLPATLWERFQSPHAEWSGYTLGTKIKIFFLSFGALGVTVAALISKSKQFNLSKREIGMSLMTCFAMGIYCVHYFIIHPYMWLRYFQPALYAGFGLFVFWGAKWVKSTSLNWRTFFLPILVLILLLQVNQARKHPLLEPSGTYARSCTDIYGKQCDPFMYK